MNIQTAEYKELKQTLIDELIERASHESLRRARVCLHNNHEDQVQEMVIAFCRDSYIPPHRHLNKSESFHMIHGEIMVVLFDDDGNVVQLIQMGEITSGKTTIFRLNSCQWHMIIPLSNVVVLHEVTTGPFIPDSNLFPLWMPALDDKKQIDDFLRRIAETLEQCNSMSLQ